MKKVTFLILLLSITTVVFGQKKQKNKKKVEKIEAPDDLFEEEVEIELDIEIDNGYALDREEKKRIPDDNFEYETINDDYDFFYDRREKSYYKKKYGIVGKQGDIILPAIFKKSGSVYDGKVILKLGTRYGLFNINTNQWSLPIQYEELKKVSYNSDIYQAKVNGLWGLLDEYGNIISKFQWKRINTISGLNNYLITSIESNGAEQYGIYSILEKKSIVPYEYRSINQISNQNYFKVKKNEKYNIINIENKLSLTKWYDELILPQSGRNYYIVSLDNRMGVIDSNEKLIVPITYLEIGNSPYSDGSYLAKNSQGKYGFMRIDGSVTLPFQYDNLTKVNYNSVFSVKGQKCGLVQINSGIPTEIVTCDYDNVVQNESDYSIIVETNNKYGILDRYGDQITEIKYNSLEQINYDNGYIYKGLLEGSYYLIDQQGQLITQQSFDEIGIIPDYDDMGSYQKVKFSYFKVKKGEKYEILDKIGKSISDEQFDDITFESKNFLVVESDNKYAIFNLLDSKLMTGYDYDQIAFEDKKLFGFKNNAVEQIEIKGQTIEKKLIKL